MRDLLGEYKEDVYQCARKGSSFSFLTACDRVPKREIELRFRQDPYVSFAVKAVSALVAAFRLVQLERCPGASGANCLRQTADTLHEDILTNLRRLSFSTMMQTEAKTRTRSEGDHSGRHHFTRQGRLVASRQQVYTVDGRTGLKLVSI